MENLDLTGMTFQELGRLQDCLFLLLEYVKESEKKNMLQKEIDRIEARMEEVWK